MQKCQKKKGKKKVGNVSSGAGEEVGDKVLTLVFFFFFFFFFSVKYY